MSIHVPLQRRSATPAGAAPAAAGEETWSRVLRTAASRGVLVLLASLLLWSALPLALGWTPRVIMSGSMEPRLHVGDVVVTRVVPAARLAEGQVVTVQDPDHPGRTRTHRMVRRDADGRLVTQGDANPQPDSSRVGPDQVLGLAVLRVPLVGRPAVWLAEGRPVPVGLAGLGLALCVLGAFPSRRPRDERPGPPSGPSATRRPSSRVAVAAAVSAVVAVGAGTPADAAFTDGAANPTSSLAAASTFYPYRTAVAADSPYLVWKLDETSGTTVADASGNGRTATSTGTRTLGRPGALAESPDRAYATTSAMITAGTSVAGPSTFSVEAWISTTSTTGGRIIGFGNNGGSTTSTTLDRQLYLAPGGKVYFGIGAAKTVLVSPTALNDGAWHHVVGTYTSGNNGMKLYVDGSLAATGKAAVQAVNGYWRAAGEAMSGWTGNPSDNYFDGVLDEVAVYTTVLSAARVQAHWAAAS